MRIAVLALAVLLGACTTTQALTAAQANEKAMTEANDLYAATATALNAYALADPARAAQVNAIELKAWADLMAVREVYAAGATIILTALQADEAQASAVTGAPALAPAGS